EPVVARGRRRRARAHPHPPRRPARRHAPVLAAPCPRRQDRLDGVLAGPRGPARRGRAGAPARAAGLRRAAPRGGVTLTDDIRAGAARVAAAARSVRIVEDAIEAYARSLPAESPPAPDLEGAD